MLEGMVTVVRVEEDSPRRSRRRPARVGAGGGGGPEPGGGLATLRELEAPMQRTLAQIQISVGVNGAPPGSGGVGAGLTFQDSAGDSRTLTLTRREAPAN